jgi:hypothetical protein
MAQNQPLEIDNTITEFDRTFDIPEENIEKVKSYFRFADLVIRILAVIVIAANFAYRLQSDHQYYTEAEQRFIVLSVVLILIGIQNASFVFYPCIHNLRIPLFVTFLLLFFVTTLKGRDSYMLVIRSDKDFVYRISEFCFFFVFMPNIGTLIFALIFGVVFLFIFILLSSLSRFGLVRLPMNNQRRNVVETNAQIFKKKYLKFLQGHFYAEPNDRPTEVISMIDDHHNQLIDETETLYKVKSCDHDQDHTKGKYLHASKPEVKSENGNNDGQASCRDPLCCICYLRFRESSYVLTLPVCQHVFHYNCIMSWLKKNPSCPVCRHDLLVYYRGISP